MGAVIQEYDLLQNLICSFLWALTVFLNWPQFVGGNKGTNYVCFGILMTLMCIFGYIGADFYNYQDLYNDMATGGKRTHIEAFYYFLIRIIPDNYLIWRAVVWGLASIFLLNIFKQLGCDTYFSCFCTAVLLLFQTFYYLRNSLGFSVMYYGVSVLLIKEKKGLKSVLLAIALIATSYFLHKSMFAYIAIMLISFIPINRFIILGALALFPVLYNKINIFATDFILPTLLGDDPEAIGAAYINNESQLNPTFMGLIQLMLDKIPIILLLGYGIALTYFKKKDSLKYKPLLINSFWLIYLSFLFFGQELSNAISTRFWLAALFPLTIFISANFYEYRTKTIVRFSFISILLASILTITSTLLSSEI